MEVLNPNNVKIYNLTSGKTLPDWIGKKKAKALMKEDVGLQSRIELLQDFEFPQQSNCIEISKDNNYVLTTGVYGPRLRCFDVSQLAMKFERGYDAEAINLLMLSDDYSKWMFMHADRYLEFHTSYGRYYRTRIPKYGRDMSYHAPSCDVYIAAKGSDVYRLNLEQGRFLNSLSTDADDVLSCTFNPEHQLFTCGTQEGTVECWDPRVRKRVGLLDCSPPLLNDEEMDCNKIPGMTAVTYKDGLNLAAGTDTGHIMLYDLRSSKPLLIKDHNYGLPIKKVMFHQDLVLSLDEKVLKIWKERNGKAYTTIQSTVKLNKFVMFPNTGLIMMTNDAPKLQAYYVPSLGPAPKWAAFLDSLTEELEENPTPTVYDDYKFLSGAELQELGLGHLIGSEMVRAYMHGFFINNKLYHKAKEMAQPFKYSDYRKQKIQEKIRETRANRVVIEKKKKKSVVNQDLAEAIKLADKGAEISGEQAPTAILRDSRFDAMFTNPDFQIDERDDKYRQLDPVINKINKTVKKAKQFSEEFKQEIDSVVEEKIAKPTSDDSASESDSESDSDDEFGYKKMTKERLRKNKQKKAKNVGNFKSESFKKKEPRMVTMSDGHPMMKKTNKEREALKKRKMASQSFASRLESEGGMNVKRSKGQAEGNLEMTFTVKSKSDEKTSERDSVSKQHLQERRQNIRPARGVGMKERRGRGRGRGGFR